MPVKYNVDRVLKNWKASGGKSKFEKSLRHVLIYIQNDPNITNMAEAAYLLATAKAESDYSLQRWESDYMCGPAGVAYKKHPCSKALNYYRSTGKEGRRKKNYYNLGVDRYGMPYFGRGLIQLTGKSNYEKYGKIIGVDLVSNGDRALVPMNSYKIASAYLHLKTFKYVNAGNLTRARKSVNGGTRGLSEVNHAFNKWMNIFKQSGFTTSTMTRQARQAIMYSGVAVSFLSLIGVGVYTVRKYGLPTLPQMPTLPELTPVGSTNDSQI
jgi:predicted chitinase